MNTNQLPKLKWPFEWHPEGHKIYLEDEEGLPVLDETGELILNREADLVCAYLYFERNRLGIAHFSPYLRKVVLLLPENKEELPTEYWWHLEYGRHFLDVIKTEMNIEGDERHTTEILASYFDALA